MTGTSEASTQSTQEESGQSGPSDSAGKSDGSANIDCVNCTRTVCNARTRSTPATEFYLLKVASNRFAQHLATCLGLGTGVRRAAPRTAVTKTKWVVHRIVTKCPPNVLLGQRTGAQRHRTLMKSLMIPNPPSPSPSPRRSKQVLA